ncbi:ribbon-helix-helix domain-containing protein [Candidatus Igneacidithiobacillus taiwanensis]|uniref:ribbon-helix-helix domain-containing protein n=1 Tax=Candidatus Igneacidithiobacillus taiwanensis TaxID=1945924 RepID=UPI00289CE035|nr:ribbon-helix-helix domain-containing protein [Candidatus Igneacidithiobacillus taiwanensis]
MNAIRWNVVVSPDTDQTVRMFLASRGGGRKGDLSRFIEQAVRAYIFERSVEEAKKANASLSEEELAAVVNEAVEWARNH